MSKLPQLICIDCGKTPDELPEYVSSAEAHGMMPDEYVWREEGTLNPFNGHFLCTKCYISAGMPSGPTGWTAP